MIKIKTYLDKSKISGIGLFAAEDVSQNTIIWEFDPNVDLIVSCDVIKNYPSVYRFVWKNKNNECILGLDDDRFMNHSRNPNVSNTIIDGKEVCIARYFLPKGTELVTDYRELMPEDEWEDYY